MTGEYIWVKICSACILEHMAAFYSNRRYVDNSKPCKFCDKLTRVELEIWV